MLYRFEYYDIIRVWGRITCQILQYSDTYHNAHQQSTMSNHSPQNFVFEHKKNLSSDEYKIFLNSKAKGWEGLERHQKSSPSSNFDTMMMNPQTLVTQVVRRMLK
jgi:hypothetical protein